MKNIDTRARILSRMFTASRMPIYKHCAHTHRFIGGAEDLSMKEAATILGAGIGKPELAYVQFDPASAKAGMMQAGIPETIAADGYNELFDALNSGNYQDGYVRTPEATTPTTFKWFVENEFKHAFAG